MSGRVHGESSAVKAEPSMNRLSAAGSYAEVGSRPGGDTVVGWGSSS